MTNMLPRGSSSEPRRYGYMRCPCCGRRQRIYVGEVWDRLSGDASIRIVEPDRDGAIIEQLERPQDGRWGLSYRQLIAGFRRREDGHA